MKRIFYLLYMLIGLSFSASSQERLSIEIVDGVQESYLRMQIEKQTQLLFAAINHAALNSSNTIDFRGVDISSFARKTILMLWDNMHFRTIENVIVERCVEIRTNEQLKGYQIRNIEVELLPLSDTVEKDVKEICIEEDKNGAITDFSFVLEKPLIARTLKEGESFGDIDKRMAIVIFCEKLKTAFYSKDISYIDSFFEGDKISVKELYNNKCNVYEKKDKHDYLKQIHQMFMQKRNMEVNFDDLEITRHSTKIQYYGVSFILNVRSHGNNGLYTNPSRIFMIFDFAEEENPVLCIVRVQPTSTPREQLYDINDFKLK